MGEPDKVGVALWSLAAGSTSIRIERNTACAYQAIYDMT